MSSIQKNEGIEMSGGTIKANAIGVGKGATVIVIGSSRDDQIEPSGQEPDEVVLLLNLLRSTILELFNNSELCDLCFQLGVDYERLSGKNKSDKVRELILLLKRTGQLGELINQGQQLRPQGNWTLTEKEI